MTGGGQNKPDWSSKTSDGSMDTRSTTPDKAAEKVKPHSDRASEGKGEGTGGSTPKGVSGETAGALKDQVGKAG
jgi:hypothetical protein